jgi:alpha-2-macroglobulin
VATRRGQSQLRGRIPAALPVALTLLLLGAAPRAGAQYQASGYEPLSGQPFFLLSDKSYGPDEVAQVRVEVSTGGFGLSQVEAYGGVDVVVYRVPRPLAFLERQRNLHRVEVEGLPREEGLANTLAHLWDRWYRASRVAWRRIFSAEARASVTAQAPELKTPPKGVTEFVSPPQWSPLPGYDLVERFRYPVHYASPIKPPAQVQLAGSSSEFISAAAGNVMVPLGRLEPGLYIVEGYVGSHRANTLVFVGSSVAVTKASASEMLVWTAHRTTGTAVAGVSVVWTDGTGVLQRGTTDAQGLARLEHGAPERSYLFGADGDGGVFISESFYYDSEIYDAKVYAVTDRPLYRPGDQVFVKLMGRTFQSARDSVPLAAGAVTLTVFDPNGVAVETQKLRLSPGTGADTSFRLPEAAVGGGYELRFAYGQGTYSAAFRVAEYQKPHFEINVVQDKPEFKTKEPINGRLQLNYPDGKPVRDAQIQLTARSQRLTMVDGELGYYGQFPVKLETETLRSDAKGEAPFSLPAAEEPSRYVLTAFATDGAAYRVKTTRELLVERSLSAYAMRAERPFSTPGETVAFAVAPIGAAGDPPVAWEWVRLEDRAHDKGALVSPERLEVHFEQPGSYTVQLRDARGNVVGGAPHWVSGPGLTAPAGSIEIVPSKDTCAPGEVVELLLTFAEPVDDALLTLERDRVEEATLMSAGSGWVEASRITPTQWRARLPVRADFAPNVTFSVAYVRNGDYVFQNQGLKVARPRIDVALRTNKRRYAPGETVVVDVSTAVAGRPAPAVVAVGVVDEMIFALQPEIAPAIEDFFYHPRRNNVRTSSSLSFISYDLAKARSKGAPAPHGVQERRVKVLERPRREDVDTAAWRPSLRTDASGHARFTFVMPDSLTRWRITARAMSADGTVGQRTANVLSEKALYAKWTSPRWQRKGDLPIATIALFNQTSAPREADLSISAPGLEATRHLTLRPGATFVAQPIGAITGDGAVRLTVSAAGKVVDSLETPLERIPPGWRSPRTLVLDVKGPRVPLPLPADARSVRVRLASSSAAQFSRVVDDLLEYPYGCVEQTASRMIPFALAIESLGPEAGPLTDRLRQQLNGQRTRLAYMAGPKAWFTWWRSEGAEDPFLTAYAYYADWRAARALGIERTTDHWSRLLDVYAESAGSLPVLHRALMVSWMGEMGLPVKSLLQGLQSELAGASLDAAPRRRLSRTSSRILEDPDDRLGRAFAIVIASVAGRRLDVAPAPGFDPLVTRANVTLQTSGSPEAEALLVAAGLLPATEAFRLLAAVTSEMPTLERALTLTWLDGALGGRARPAAEVALLEPWRRTTTLGGATVWRWPAGRALPTELQLAKAPSLLTSAIVQFESGEEAGPSLPAKLERRLFQVKPAAEGQQLVPVDAESVLESDGLYLDEIRLSPGGRPLRHAVVEVPLPPGASVESTTWGVNLRNAAGQLEGLERARHEATPFGYAVPLDAADADVVLRHLVRFAERGTFVVPAARAYRMYQPDAKALENEGRPHRWEVR